MPAGRRPLPRPALAASTGQQAPPASLPLPPGAGMPGPRGRSAASLDAPASRRGGACGAHPRCRRRSCPSWSSAAAPSSPSASCPSSRACPSCSPSRWLGDPTPDGRRGQGPAHRRVHAPFFCCEIAGAGRLRQETPWERPGRAGGSTAPHAGGQIRARASCSQSGLHRRHTETAATGRGSLGRGLHRRRAPADISLQEQALRACRRRQNTRSAAPHDNWTVQTAPPVPLLSFPEKKVF